jgi:heptosyltransferase-3
MIPDHAPSASFLACAPSIPTHMLSSRQTAPMRILAIQLNQPGDAILTTPALRWLMDQGHEVHALLQPLGAELLAAMPGLGSVEALSRGSIQLRRDLGRTFRYRRVGFDWAIVFSKCSDRPALWAFLSGAKKRTGLHVPHGAGLAEIGLINDWIKGPNIYSHSAQHHLYLAGAPKAAICSQKLEYHPPSPDQAWAAEWMRARGLVSGGYLLLHAAARWPSKYWPMANLAQFILRARKTLGLPLLVTAGRDPFEVEFTRELVAQAQPDHHEIGTLTVNQFGALLANSAAFVGVDSMPMHLAAALDKPGVALFGPTDENVWGPWQSRLTVLRTDCRCLREGARSCPKGPESHCLATLSADAVLERLAKIIGKAP